MRKSEGYVAGKLSLTQALGTKLLAPDAKSFRDALSPPPKDARRTSSNLSRVVVVVLVVKEPALCTQHATVNARSR